MQYENICKNCFYGFLPFIAQAFAYSLITIYYKKLQKFSLIKINKLGCTMCFVIDVLFDFSMNAHVLSYGCDLSFWV